MPVLSLPLQGISTGLVEYLPIRVPFPFMRIASILPQAINEPIKSSLLALFKLAWSAKVQLPVLITVCFMAFDIRLQLEINIFWETNNVRQQGHHAHGNNRNAAVSSGQRRTSREDMRRAALVAAALYQQQRRRLIQEMRAEQARQREGARRQSLPLQVPINAPLATAEDNDLEDCHEDRDSSGSDTLTCSHRSTASEAGSIANDEDETDDDDEENGLKKKKKKVKRSRPSSREPDDEDDDEDSSTDEDDDDDLDNDGMGGLNGGSSHGGGYRDDSYDQDSDDMGDDDNSNADGGGGYGSPLVVEVEIRHRAFNPSSDEKSCQVPKYYRYRLGNSHLHRKFVSDQFNKLRYLNSVFITWSHKYLL